VASKRQGLYGCGRSSQSTEGLIINISISKVYELKMRYPGKHDPITVRYNRIYFNNVISASLSDKDKANKLVLILNIKKKSLEVNRGYYEMFFAHNTNWKYNLGDRIFWNT
jgi:hypothetical protein